MSLKELFAKTLFLGKHWTVEHHKKRLHCVTCQSMIYQYRRIPFLFINSFSYLWTEHDKELISSCETWTYLWRRRKREPFEEPNLTIWKKETSQKTLWSWIGVKIMHQVKECWKMTFKKQTFLKLSENATDIDNHCLLSSNKRFLSCSLTLYTAHLAPSTFKWQL